MDLSINHSTSSISDDSAPPARTYMNFEATCISVVVYWFKLNSAIQARPIP